MISHPVSPTIIHPSHITHHPFHQKRLPSRLRFTNLPHHPLKSSTRLTRSSQRSHFVRRVLILRHRQIINRVSQTIMNAKGRLYICRYINLGVSVRIRQRGLVLRVNVAADTTRGRIIIIPPGRAAGALGRDLEMRRVDICALFQNGVVRVGVDGRGVVAAVFLWLLVGLKEKWWERENIQKGSWFVGEMGWDGMGWNAEEKHTKQFLERGRLPCRLPRRYQAGCKSCGRPRQSRPSRRRWGRRSGGRCRR